MDTRVSPGQEWAPVGGIGSMYRVHEVYDNLDGGREDYATMHYLDGSHAFTMNLRDLRRDYVLTKDVPVDTPRNPAETDAHKNGWPVVLVTPHDAVMIAQGRSIASRDKDGNPVLVRLFRPDEFKATLERVAETVSTGMPVPDDDRIEELVRPVRLP
jgi:hypothetical protein